MSGNGEFLNALRFITIVPVPSSDAAIEPDWLSRCAKYFPVVGIGIGLASAVVLLLAGRIWGPVVASLLAVATSIAVTGALHEDGLADTADGLGGGARNEGLARRRHLPKLVAGVNLGRHRAYRKMLAAGFRTELQGVTMHRPNELGYDRSTTYLIDDWR